MAQGSGEKSVRGRRKKRPPRPTSGERIVVRLNAEEKQHLLQLAGEVGISAYVRSRLFGGGVRDRDGLRKIAALHRLGRTVQVLAGNPDGNESSVAATLAAVRAAIASLICEVPEADDEVVA